MVNQALEFSTEPRRNDSVSYLLFSGNREDLVSPRGTARVITCRLRRTAYGSHCRTGVPDGTWTLADHSETGRAPLRVGLIRFICALYNPAPVWRHCLRARHAADSLGLAGPLTEFGFAGGARPGSSIRLSDIVTLVRRVYASPRTREHGVTGPPRGSYCLRHAG